MNQATRTAPLIILLSLLATPWLLLVSTASALYLKNQIDLYHRHEVLFPFLSLAAALLCIGVVLAWVAGKWRQLQPLLWGYYLLAPLYMVYQSVAGLLVQPVYVVLWAALVGILLVALSVLLTRKLNPFRAAQLFAMIGCAFIAMDCYSFYAQYRPYQTAYWQPAGEGQQNPDRVERPNVYHIILDEYQVEMFKLTLTPQVRASLGGFTLFEDTAAVFGRTEMSLPSIFSGRHYDFESPPVDYQQAGFAGKNSLLSPLKEQGYQTSAVMFPVFDFELEGFDGIAFHEKVGEFDYSSTDKTFQKLWIFSVFPSAIVSRFLNPVDMDQLKRKNLLTLSAPIESYQSMVNITREERHLPANNRYQLVHLLVPHFPYVLREDCGYTHEEKTSAMEQAHCATRLVVDFIDTLKELDRYEESMIVIQSDHGARFRIVDGKLRGLGESNKIRFGTAWSWARSRALLLVKPAGVSGANVGLDISDSRASLLDVAPTIVQSLELPTTLSFDGRNLLDSRLSDTVAPRYYYFYNKKDARGKHLLNMTRFRVEDTGLVDEGLVKSGVFF